jgi:hypothetical protein
MAARPINLASDEAVTRFARHVVGHVPVEAHRVPARRDWPVHLLSHQDIIAQTAASPVRRTPPCALVRRLGGPSSPGEPPGTVARLTPEEARAGYAASRSRVAA